MKRLKQWEDEKSVLDEGLDAIEKARSFYETRMAAVREKLRNGTSSIGATAFNTEAAEVGCIFHAHVKSAAIMILNLS